MSRSWSYKFGTQPDKRGLGPLLAATIEVLISLLLNIFRCTWDHHRIWRYRQRLFRECKTVDAWNWAFCKPRCMQNPCWKQVRHGGDQESKLWRRQRTCKALWDSIPWDVSKELYQRRLIFHHYVQGDQEKHIEQGSDWSSSRGSKEQDKVWPGKLSSRWFRLSEHSWGINNDTWRPWLDRQW